MIKFIYFLFSLNLLSNSQPIQSKMIIDNRQHICFIDSCENEVYQIVRDSCGNLNREYLQFGYGMYK